MCLLGTHAVKRVPHAAAAVCVSLQMQAGLTAMLYVKSARISCNVSKGEVMTLATTDATRLKRLSEHVHKIWSAPVCVLLSLVLVIRLLGASALAGVGVALLILLVNWRSSKTFQAVNDDIMTHQQSRMQRFAEILEVRPP